NGHAGGRSTDAVTHDADRRRRAEAPPHFRERGDDVLVGDAVEVEEAAFRAHRAAERFAGEDAGVEHPRARSIVEQPDVPAEAAQMHREPAVRYEEGLAARVAAVDEQYGAVPDG